MESPIQTSLSALLAESDDARALLGEPVRLFDHFQPRARLPQAWWGRARSDERPAGETRLIDHRFSLHLETSHMSRAAAKAALSVLRDILAGAAPDPGEGWRLVRCAPVYCDIFQTENDTRLRGVIRMHALAEKL